MLPICTARFRKCFLSQFLILKTKVIPTHRKKSCKRCAISCTWTKRHSLTSVPTKYLLAESSKEFFTADPSHCQFLQAYRQSSTVKQIDNLCIKRHGISLKVKWTTSLRASSSIHNIHSLSWCWTAKQQNTWRWIWRKLGH